MSITLHKPHKPMVFLTDEAKVMMIEEYAAGSRACDLMVKYDISPATFFNARSRYIGFTKKRQDVIVAPATVTRQEKVSSLEAVLDAALVVAKYLREGDQRFRGVVKQTLKEG